MFWFVGAFIAPGQEQVDDFMLDLPFLGPLYNWVFKPITYYKQDTAEMFQTAVHQSVLEVIDAIIKEKGIRALSEESASP